MMLILKKKINIFYTKEEYIKHTQNIKTLDTKKKIIESSTTNPLKKKLKIKLSLKIKT